VAVAGAIAMTTGVTVTNGHVADCVLAEPGLFDLSGAPGSLDWTTALGSTLGASGSSGTSRFRITFPRPIPAGAVLYELPLWRVTAFTRMDAHTIQMTLEIAGGAFQGAFVLGSPMSSTVLTGLGRTSDNQLSLRLGTRRGYHYSFERTVLLAPVS
jgi:hypothetical protein